MKEVKKLKEADVLKAAELIELGINNFCCSAIGEVVGGGDSAAQDFARFYGRSSHTFWDWDFCKGKGPMDDLTEKLKTQKIMALLIYLEARNDV